MKYRQLGRTGLRISEIGLGCEGFVRQDEEFTTELFEYALSHGVNCMDLYSPEPELRSRIGKLLHGRREQFILQSHLCTIWKNGQYKATRDLDEVKSSFLDSLKRYQTDYIDIGMIHYVDSTAVWQEIAQGKVMEYMQQQKEKGAIRYVGLSSHNPIAALAAVQSGLVDVLMFSVNPCYDLLPADENCEKLWSESSYTSKLVNLDPDREKLYEACQSMGIGITVMKAFGGGDLLSDYSPAGKALTVNQCIHYALTRPAVACVMSGARSMEELKANLAYEHATDKEKDYAEVFTSFTKISWQGHCMYCGHCAPCPKGIDIAMVTKFLNLVKAQGFVPETIREHYAALKQAAQDCIRCGQCEKRCPFGVPIQQNMFDANQLFCSRKGE